MYRAITLSIPRGLSSVSSAATCAPVCGGYHAKRCLYPWCTIWMPAMVLKTEECVRLMSKKLPHASTAAAVQKTLCAPSACLIGLIAACSFEFTFVVGETGWILWALLYKAQYSLQAELKVMLEGRSAGQEDIWRWSAFVLSTPARRSASTASSKEV